MKRLFIFIFFLMMTFHATADEVGNTTFVTEPKAEPLFTSQGGTRYWSCNGFVNAKLIKIVFTEMATLAKAEKIAAPTESLCLYSIGSIALGGQAIPIFQMDYYVNQASMEQCLYNDSCLDFRAMTFKISNGKLHRQYMLTSAQKKQMRMACIEMTGKVAEANGGCP